jgi:hypothetical protein
LERAAATRRIAIRRIIGSLRFRPSPSLPTALNSCRRCSRSTNVTDHPRGLERTVTVRRTSIATRWRSCGLPQSASCSENFVIPPDVFGQPLNCAPKADPRMGQDTDLSASRYARDLLGSSPDYARGTRFIEAVNEDRLNVFGFRPARCLQSASLAPQLWPSDHAYPRL